MRISLEMQYPQSLIYEVFRAEALHIFGGAVTDDQVRGLEFALETLTPREATALVMRYEHEMKLYEVGEKLGVSRSRAEQIINMAVRKMRHPSRKELVQFGYDGCMTMREAREQKIAKEFRAVCDQLEPVAIEQLDLSDRAYSALKSADITTAKGIITKTDEELLAIPNIGRRSLREIRMRVAMLEGEIKRSITENE